MATMQYKLNNDINTKTIFLDWLSAENRNCTKTNKEKEAINESR